MIRSKAKFRRGRAAAFAWLAALLAALMLYWWFMVNHGVRDFWDPTYAQKTGELRACLKAHPGRPLWIVFGTSHVDFALRPGIVADRLNGPGDPLIFNFGLSGAGVFRQSVVLRRLLADGFTPRRVGIELMAPLMDRKTDMFADDPRLALRARPGELDELCSRATNPDETRAAWKESRINPLYKYGMRLADQGLVLRLLPIPGITRLEDHPYDIWGWSRHVPETQPPAVYQKALHAAGGEFVNDFKGNFAVSEPVDRVLRATIELCRSKGIDVFLLRMPEGLDFQAYYSPGANETLVSYEEGIKKEYNVPVIDARSWYPGSEYYLDGHHLNAVGAKAFTERFVDELLKK